MDLDKVRGMLYGAAVGFAVGGHYVGNSPGATPPLPGSAPASPPLHGSGSLRTLEMLQQAFAEVGLLRGFTHAPFDSTSIAPLISRLAVHLRIWAQEDASTLDSHSQNVARRAGYTERPVVVANDMPTSPHDAAVLLRALAAALLPTAEQAEQVAILACHVTHRTPSLVGASTLIALLLQAMLHRLGSLKEVLTYAAGRIQAHVPQGAALSRISEALHDEELRMIGGRDYSGRHLGGLRAFMGAFRAVLAQPDPLKSFEEALMPVVAQGGAADINGAIAGAVCGARLGVAALPPWHREIVDAGRVEQMVEGFVAQIEARHAKMREMIAAEAAAAAAAAPPAAAAAPPAEAAAAAAAAPPAAAAAPPAEAFGAAPAPPATPAAAALGSFDASAARSSQLH